MGEVQPRARWTLTAVALLAALTQPALAEAGPIDATHAGATELRPATQVFGAAHDATDLGVVSSRSDARSSAQPPARCATGPSVPANEPRERAPWRHTARLHATRFASPERTDLRPQRPFFETHESDAVAALHCAGASDPSSGLFLQRDPSGYTDSVNLYAGFKNDPVNLRDPTGRWVNIVGGAFIGGLVGGALDIVRQAAELADAGKEVSWANIDFDRAGGAALSGAFLGAAVGACPMCGVGASVVGVGVGSYSATTELLAEKPRYRTAAVDAGGAILSALAGARLNQAIKSGTVPKIDSVVAKAAVKVRIAAQEAGQRSAQALLAARRNVALSLRLRLGTMEDPKGTTTLFHFGSLSDGKVQPGRILSTSPSSNLGHYHPNGRLYEFRVPRSALAKWVREGSARHGTDLHEPTGIVRPEVRISGRAADEMNQYLVVSEE
ncbi:hypothetical protein L6R52_13970 [Myxococcota bacterium]|nr:hypothetical protein [Myxococcota bacterium]